MAERLTNTMIETAQARPAATARSARAPRILQAAPCWRVDEVRSDADYRQAGRLVRLYTEYVHSDLLRRTLPPELLKDIGAEFACLAAEHTHLEQHYARPGGRFLLARHAGKPVGCVGLRAIGPGAVEMKRLFVLPEFGRSGLGTALAEAALALAAADGWSTMRLECFRHWRRALRLYRRLGFVETAPYRAAGSPALAAMALSLDGE